MNTSSPRRSRLRAKLATALLAALPLLSCGPQGSDPASAALRKADEALGGVRAAPPAKTTVPASLGEMPEAVARLETLREEVERAIPVDDAELEATAALDAALRRVGRLRTRVDGLPLDELTEVSRRLAATTRSVRDAGEVVGTRLHQIEAGTRQVDELKATFEAFALLAEQAGVPPALRLRAGVCRAQLDDLAAQLARRRTQLLVLVDKLAEARGGAAAMTADTQQRFVESRRRFAASLEEPIWNLGISGQEARTLMAARLSRDTLRVRRWFESNLPRILLLTIVFLGGTVLLLHRLRPGAHRRAASDPSAAAGVRFMESPLAAGIPVTVLALVVLSPEPPAIIYDLAWLPGAPAAAWVIVKVLGPAVRRTVWVLAASLAVTPLAGALGALPFTDRLTTVLQTGPLAVVLALDLYQGRLSGHAGGGRAAGVLKAVLWLLSGCLGLATAGMLVGRVGLATVLGSGALGTLGGIAMLVAAYLVAAGLIRSLLASEPAQGLRMVREHADVVAESCLAALRVLGVLVVLAISVKAFGIGPWLGSLFAGFLGAKAKVGSITISPGSLLGFALVLWISVLVSRLLGFLLAEEVLPRFDLRRGTAVAISGITRYLLLVGGFVLAAGVAGIDLTTFGFVAGALGVGIGFGLQNIVSNFISGLILLFERPIQVGDAVDVPGASGTVTQIGIRASTVRTFDGADVIVPNADLISKPVTNWTGANPDRRFDVSVGVAYGSPLETTAQALLAAARRTPGVHTTTPPEAFFQSFGDSALDWTLRVWVRMDESPKVLSDLKRAVSEELEREKIEVPFPQRDLHIRSVAPGALGAPGGESR
ncbi:MAG: mechanosensitive ion channel [Holophagales bacterium]|nr:mechanosensitive ion channel [Holophagales bacterium]